MLSHQEFLKLKSDCQKVVKLDYVPAAPFTHVENIPYGSVATTIAVPIPFPLHDTWARYRELNPFWSSPKNIAQFNTFHFGADDRYKSEGNPHTHTQFNPPPSCITL